ncbi:hypothetical protein LEP1GSC195_0924 [Leptospira wolbachii serovar Codice str. CDC]|uniref:Uncharacterized protein n=1 Tax=Leptospira wolbachii serovar Codice str. CDC TaxID=1218599 RepID=R8ZYA7_9LEPT|nr:hypothetical protein LEP1GSC195_0924 [Leptospira wolbachii serovar Codice str. CDC]
MRSFLCNSFFWIFFLSKEYQEASIDNQIISDLCILKA